MQELRIVFIVAGVIAILGILVHGLWSIRKNAQVKKSLAAELLPPEEKADTLIDSDDPLLDQNIDFQPVSRNEPIIDSIEALETEDAEDTVPTDLHEDYDDLGLGPVRVVSQPKVDPSDTEEHHDSETDDLDSPSIASEGNQTKSDKLFGKAPEYDMRLSRPDRNDEWVESSMPQPPNSLLRGESVEHSGSVEHEQAPEDMMATPSEETPSSESVPPFSSHETETPSPSEHEPSPKESLQPQVREDTDSKPSLAEQARNLVKRKKTASSKRKEPKLSDDQMSIDFDDTPEAVEAPVGDTEKPEPVEQEVLVLNVKAADGAPIPGAALLPMLLTLGFKFGDQDIFHRHVNSNGKGPVLFSLANMFKPGIFDIDNLENFSTQGISLFMILPIEGDAHQVFNMMHNAARKISDEFGAQVLDGRRSRLNKQSLQQYVEKIREFERKRMIRRH